MPIYEYECTGCHHTFDVIQKISDTPLTLCPHCSMNTAVRLVSAAGFQLKGTGWYATDFKDKPASEKKSAKQDSSNSASADTSATTGSVAASPATNTHES